MAPIKMTSKILEQVNTQLFKTIATLFLALTLCFPLVCFSESEPSIRELSDESIRTVYNLKPLYPLSILKRQLPGPSAINSEQNSESYSKEQYLILVASDDTIDIPVETPTLYAQTSSYSYFYSNLSYLISSFVIWKINYNPVDRVYYLPRIFAFNVIKHGALIANSLVQMNTDVTSSPIRFLFPIAWVNQLIKISTLRSTVENELRISGEISSPIKELVIVVPSQFFDSIQKQMTQDYQLQEIPFEF